MKGKGKVFSVLTKQHAMMDAGWTPKVWDDLKHRKSLALPEVKTTPFPAILLILIKFVYNISYCV
jgi:hypothetical protein